MTKKYLFFVNRPPIQSLGVVPGTECYRDLENFKNVRLKVNILKFNYLTTNIDFLNNFNNNYFSRTMRHIFNKFF